MAIAPKLVRSMRIIALPLTRPNIPPDKRLNPKAVFNPNRMLIYYHFNLISASGSASIEADRPRIKRLVKWASTKAADVWAGFGKAPEGSWQLRTYEYGERLVDRIDFEELVLKAIDPSLGPTVVSSAATDMKHDKIHIIENQRETIPLIYPPSIYNAFPTALSDASHPCLEHLRTLLKTREPRHRKGFWTWLTIAPLTAPFMIIPVVPNLPFFFCAWRAWSHYRDRVNVFGLSPYYPYMELMIVVQIAYRSSQYLTSLLDHELVVPTPSEELDELYKSSASTLLAPGHAAPTPSSNPSSERPSQVHSSMSIGATDISTAHDAHKSPERLLLTRKAIPRILELFGLSESAGADMYRAVEQVRGRLGGGSGK
ncbi:mitochondrial K+-H+ exchange-related-domain-containing protein [Hygrophoropsis aurantiaca]|uniref:Mitochondrial K+-H+ exchange-related-domain-containing protein n=1 Tax=Hygrophoropsis aurantiaca TaxID=72124 RepID=A0ACB8AL74_9AGAM|nr:mitochondrial K+-H+ exchange-related-domain-containing protein [Hygrophoropsis aurantiaca]